MAKLRKLTRASCSQSHQRRELRLELPKALQRFKFLSKFIKNRIKHTNNCINFLHFFSKMIKITNYVLLYLDMFMYLYFIQIKKHLIRWHIRFWVWLNPNDFLPKFFAFAWQINVFILLFELRLFWFLALCFIFFYCFYLIHSSIHIHSYSYFKKFISNFHSSPFDSSAPVSFFSFDWWVKVSYNVNGVPIHIL